jgi:hypothetical protein
MPYRTTIDGVTYHEDTYRLTDRDLVVMTRYLAALTADLREAGVPDRRITVRAEIDAAPYSAEIEVVATPEQAAALGWRAPLDDGDDEA